MAQYYFSLNKNFKFVSINPSSVQGPGRSSGTAKILKYVLNSSSPFMIKNNIKTLFYRGCINNIKVTYNNDFEKLNTVK